jgi:hypothetical protein
MKLNDSYICEIWDFQGGEDSVLHTDDGISKNLRNVGILPQN